jgi:hypothetical protein
MREVRSSFSYGMITHYHCKLIINRGYITGEYQQTISHWEFDKQMLLQLFTAGNSMVRSYLSLKIRGN